MSIKIASFFSKNKPAGFTCIGMWQNVCIPCAAVVASILKLISNSAATVVIATAMEYIYKTQRNQMQYILEISFRRRPANNKVPINICKGRS